VEDGRVVRVAGNPDHPRSRGRLCARGNAGWRAIEDPDRLRYPLLRTGRRGEGQWRRISWDQALDLWAARTRDTLDRHGPGAIGLFSHGLSSRFLNGFMDHLGVPNRAVPSFGQCRGPRDVGFQLTFGDGPGSPARHDMARSRMIVLLGSHIGENVQTGQVAELADALGSGARLVVVDPRLSVAAGKAHRWLQIRPGTDTALLLAWINLLLTEGLHDREYVARHTVGLDRLRREVAECTPRWAAELTQLPAEAIVDEGRRMARHRPAVLIHCGRFSAWYGNDTQRARAQAILTALLGAWGRPGGYYLRAHVDLGPGACPPPHGGKRAPSVASGRHAFTHFGVAAQEIVEASVGGDPRIRHWVFHSINPAHSLPRFARTREALRAVDFIAMVDVLPTEGALWADLIVPEAMYLERHDDILAVTDHPRPFVALRQPVVPPPGEAKEPYWIVQQLAHRLGHHDCFTRPDVTAYLEDRLAPLGVTYSQLAREGIHMLPEQQPFLGDGDHRFKTPTGKIELYSETLARGGYYPVPPFEPVEQPPLGWFRLVAGRSPYHAFARTQNLGRLLEHDPHNLLWINDEVARAKGLDQGARVYLQNRDGVRTGPVRVLATPAIRTDVVYTVHGFGGRSRHLGRAHARGISDNALIDRFAVDPPTGATGMRVSFVQLVTRDGRPLEGECERSRRERAPLPEGVGPATRPAATRPATRPTDAPTTTPATDAPAQGKDPGQCGPKKNDDVFNIKPEDSC
jgi:thiosulfate reductase/polysulfide reductase chain A